MSLRLSSLAAVTALFLSTACTTPAVIANGGGGAGGSPLTSGNPATTTGGAGGSPLTSGNPATTSGSPATTATTGGGEACTTNTDCGCGCGCVNNACECTTLPGMCSNDADCGPGCECTGFGQYCEPVACTDTCPSAGATRCVGSGIETCTRTNRCLGWSAGVACPAGATCNSDGTKCIVPSASCTVSADCGCGCGCVDNSCKCTGAVPPSCTTDGDCGPACADLHCVANECVPN